LAFLQVNNHGLLTLIIKTNTIETFQGRKESITMAKKSFSISSTAMAILAIIAGVLVLFWPSFIQWVVGIFLIVWGVLALIDRK